MNNLLKRLSVKEINRRYLNLKGILSKDNAYKGPDVVQIDLTDRCKSKCLACWMHSPFLNRSQETEIDLDFSVLKVFIEDVVDSGTQEIIISGGGEPFSHPQVWEILDFIEKSGICFRLNTNFTLLNKDEVKRLASFKSLLSVTVSVWAAYAKLYSEIHGRDEADYYKVKENLELFNSSKSARVYTTLSVTVNNLNYLNIDDLFNFASRVKCNAIELSVLDAIPGKTDCLLLDDKQIKSLRKTLGAFPEFIRREGRMIRFANRDIFLRRISSPGAQEGEYDDYIDNLPCYAGWFFLRLRANGDLNSCLKSHRIPIGNIYKENFASVWNNSFQKRFRLESLNVPKNPLYFNNLGNAKTTGIGCKRVCDNILINTAVNRLLKYFRGAHLL